jgi:CheY-like chemotaxis protein
MTQRILVVEDDPALGEVVQMALTTLLETPYHVVLATTGVEAMHLVQQVRPCLLLLDYLLPGMNGLELYDHLHAMPSLATVPALLMSANLPDDDEATKRHLTVIHKPFDLYDLVQTIEQRLLSASENA